MARYALYGSTTSNQVSSKALTASYSFNISNQKSIYPNVIKPITTSNLEDKSQEAIPKNVYMDYSLQNESILTIRDKLLKTLDLSNVGAQNIFNRYTKYYNRFKLPTLDDAFQKGFAHVFFTRPDCNLLSDKGMLLNDAYNADGLFAYSWRNNNNVIKQLVKENGQNHDFMMLLSNKATSFSLADEYINTDMYGKTYKGWQIAYGRNNVESKSAGDFTVSFIDDRTLHVYNLHKLWTEYISDVYQGNKSPKLKYIKERVLDYASSCYYIITAEDGETIIFWSKYYGVFPTTAPSTQYSWAQGNTIDRPQFDIKYQYSFKEDMNPESLVEFNMNSHIESDLKYVPVYDPKLGHSGTTWVGAPYIELVTNNTDPECPWTFKLRFRSVTEK